MAGLGDFFKPPAKSDQQKDHGIPGYDYAQSHHAETQATLGKAQSLMDQLNAKIAPPDMTTDKSKGK